MLSWVDTECQVVRPLRFHRRSLCHGTQLVPNHRDPTRGSISLAEAEAVVDR